MAKKILLNTRPEPTHYTLIGISCHLKDYRLSYLLNRQLDLNLVKLDDFRDFSLYFCRDEDRMNSYFLLGNRGQETVLLPELKQTDYLLLLEGHVRKPQKEKLLEKIRSIQHVLTTFEVRFETIRNYETILNDLVIHFMNILKETKTRYAPLKKQED